jgi:hypothetical protein
MSCTPMRPTSRRDTALTEKGEVVSGRGDAVNMHDILTGSDRRASIPRPAGDTNCGKLDEERRGFGDCRSP